MSNPEWNFPFPDMRDPARLPSSRLDTIALLSSGGDARITLDKVTGLNRYLSAPYPRKSLAYASSTANDLSRKAFAVACEKVEQGLPIYSEWLDQLRGRLRTAYGLDEAQSIVFAASGTDLEYVALAAVSGRSPSGIHNILLGADEVGSGCPFSASGKYFAEQTSLGVATKRGDQVQGLEHVTLSDIAVRCDQGRARTSAQVSAEIEAELDRAKADGKHALVHVVHGSKTGLILPDMAHIDHIKAKWGDAVTFVVDACQARITSQALRDYLARGAIVFITGSKFMGGAPFNGFAFIPPAVMENVEPPCDGLRNIFRRGEWPSRWPGRNGFVGSENPGLALRLDAAIFELERFQALSFPQVERVILAFEAAIEAVLVGKHDISLVQPYAPGESEEAVTHPIEMRTLATLDVSRLPELRTFEDAQRGHRELAMNGVRLGQPVKCVRSLSGVWGGTLRIGLSMPQICDFAALEDEALAARLRLEISRIGSALVSGAGKGSN